MSDTRILRGRTVVLVGSGAFASGLGEALEAAGGEVALVEGPFASREDAEARLAPAAHGWPSLDAVVYAHVDPAWTVTRPLQETSEEDFADASEGQLLQAMWVSQACSGHFGDDGGRLAFVVPTLGLMGAAGLAGYATGAEAIRGLAKSLGRQWGPRAITANVVNVPLATLLAQADASTTRTTPWPSPFGRLPDVGEDLGAYVAFLASAGAGFVTGSTMALDGGVTMP